MFAETQLDPVEHKPYIRVTVVLFREQTQGAACRGVNDHVDRNDSEHDAPTV